MNGRVMVVASESVGWSIAVTLSRLHYEVFAATSSHVALDIAARQELDVVLATTRLPDGSGLQLCEGIARVRSDLPVVIVCSEESVEGTVGAVRAGAFDVLPGDADPAALQGVVGRALAHGQLQREVKALKEAVLI